MIARRTCEVDFDGERVSITAGVTRVVPDHELVRLHPELWAAEPDERREAAKRRRLASGNGHAAPVRSASGGGSPRRPMTAAQQQAIRTARLAELERREQQGWAGSRPSSEDVFWTQVDRLLGNGPDDIERAGVKLIEQVQATQSAAARDEIQELSAWLRDP